MHNPADSWLFCGIDEYLRVRNSLIVGNLTIRKAYPVCVVKSSGSLQSPCQLCWIIEMKRSYTYLITERIRTVGMSGERPDPLPHRKKFLGNILTRITKRTCNNIQFLSFYVHSHNLDKPEIKLSLCQLFQCSTNFSSLTSYAN